MRVGGGIPHRMVASRIELYPFCRSAIILQMATSDPIPLGPVAKCRQVRSLRGVHWDNAHQYNINDNSPILNLASGSIIPRASAQKRVYVIEVAKSLRVWHMHSQRCIHPKPQGAAWQYEWQHLANQNNHVSFFHLSRGHYYFNGDAPGHSFGRSGTAKVRYRNRCYIYSADSQPLD